VKARDAPAPVLTRRCRSARLPWGDSVLTRTGWPCHRQMAYSGLPFQAQIAAPRAVVDAPDTIACESFQLMASRFAR